MLDPAIAPSTPPPPLVTRFAVESMDSGTPTLRLQSHMHGRVVKLTLTCDDHCGRWRSFFQSPLA